MMLFKSFFRRISDDFRRKKLMPLKLIFFVNTSTLYILYPYLTIHMRELGINVEETAIMSAITPFVAIIMPPLAGLLADRIGNFKILLSLFSALGGAASLLLLLVPVGRVKLSYPSNVEFAASCGGNSSEMLYAMHQRHPCDTMLDARIDATLQSCGYACPVSYANDTELRALLMAQNYRINVADNNSSYGFAISESDMPLKMKFPPEATQESRTMKNVEYYTIAIRQLSRNVLFFPMHDRPLFDLDCSAVNGTQLCGFDGLATQPKEPRKFVATLRAMKQTDLDEVENRRRYLAHSLQLPNQPNATASCSAADGGEYVSVEIEVANSISDNSSDSEVYKTVVAEGCSRTCVLTAPRKDVCTNMKLLVEYNTQLTFWAYLVIRVFIGMIGGTAFAMFEGAVIAILRENKADYGLQRIYGSIGGMISSPLSGMLIDYASQNKGYADFRPAFYLYATLKIFSGVLMLMINLEFKAPASNVVSDVVSVLKNVEIVALLVVCFILGTAWGYIESFLFWLLEDLGASRSLMGITITVGGIAGIPLLVLSGPIIHKIGHANVLFIGFVFYAIRLLGYSLIYNPWLCLIFEALESVTSSLSFTAAVTYAAKLSTTSTDSSIQGLIGGLYYGVGKGAGSLVGGYLMKAFGTRPTYQIFAVVTLLTGLVYFFFNLMYLSKRPQVEGNDIVKKPAKTPRIEELEASKARKEKELESEPYICEDIEAINNAKNLDIVEGVEEAIKQEESELRHRHRQENGQINAAFDGDEGCNVTLESQPKGFK